MGSIVLDTTTESYMGDSGFNTELEALNSAWNRECRKRSKSRARGKNGGTVITRGSSLSSIGLELVSREDGRVIVKPKGEAMRRAFHRHLVSENLRNDVLTLSEDCIPVCWSPCTLNIMESTTGRSIVAWFQEKVSYATVGKDSSTGSGASRNGVAKRNCRVTDSYRFDYIQDSPVSSVYVNKHDWYGGANNDRKFVHRYLYQNFMCVDVDSGSAMNSVLALMDMGLPAPTLGIINTDSCGNHTGHMQLFWGFTQRCPVAVENSNNGASGLSAENRKVTDEGRRFLKLFGALNRILQGDENYTPLFGRHRNPLNSNTGNAAVLFDERGQSYYSLEYLENAVESMVPGVLHSDAAEHAVERNLQPYDRTARARMETRNAGFHSKHLARSRMGKGTGAVRDKMYDRVQNEKQVDLSGEIPEGARWEVASLIAAKATYYGLDPAEEVARLKFEEGNSPFTKKDTARVLKYAGKWVEQHPLDPSRINGSARKRPMEKSESCHHSGNVSRCLKCSERYDTAVIADPDAGTWFKRKAKANRRDVIRQRGDSNGEYSLYLLEASRGGSKTWANHEQKMRENLGTAAKRHNDASMSAATENTMRILFSDALLPFTVKAWLRHEHSRSSASSVLSDHGINTIDDWLNTLDDTTRQRAMDTLGKSSNTVISSVRVRYVDNIDHTSSITGERDGDVTRIMLDNYTGVGTHRTTGLRRSRTLSYSTYRNALKHWYQLIENADDTTVTTLLENLANRSNAALVAPTASNESNVSTVDTVNTVDSEHDVSNDSNANSASTANIEHIVDSASTVNNVGTVNTVDNEHNAYSARVARIVNSAYNADTVNNEHIANMVNSANNVNSDGVDWSVIDAVVSHAPNVNPLLADDDVDYEDKWWRKWLPADFVGAADTASNDDIVYAVDDVCNADIVSIVDDALTACTVDAVNSSLRGDPSEADVRGVFNRLGFDLADWDATGIASLVDAFRGVDLDEIDEMIDERDRVLEARRNHAVAPVTAGSAAGSAGGSGWNSETHAELMRYAERLRQAEIDSLMGTRDNDSPYDSADSAYDAGDDYDPFDIDDDDDPFDYDDDDDEDWF